MKTHELGCIAVMVCGAVGLFCCVSAWGAERGAARGKVEAAKPRYVSKDHGAWKEKGRIVGIARKAPAFEVTILDSSKQKVKTVAAEALKDGRRAYEVWLAPGTYILFIKAEGYETVDLHDLEVKRGADLRIDLEFTKGD
ncbi:MAG: carboxypeptidase regulatory-like domain-containing protein [Lentisphaerae bacterium]|jgi:hypothetical protein|nr:carboxypeptidase regulatory-like domain-containing protein [Lentisphaerota bacterium]MBT4818350.1 carboxypeptidase regulatory-like domain-containing protein [Lentisphaerota bacterium]MBT5609055.1 carboxypeptidase regulatory-like domain-containing protein [Lentisphaerota bacterium]MBT7053850.1 carboxypeptidase regulatory-like domain-containing protein [Lentisphaerota bacterium]MBT7842453.1 carboxypeptidase regulatory-like domain-containing protein [Lentisphaerota bacterium]